MLKPNSQTRKTTSFDLTAGKKAEQLIGIKDNNSISNNINNNINEFEYKRSQMSEKIVAKDLMFKKISNLNEIISPVVEPIKYEWNLPNLPFINININKV